MTEKNIQRKPNKLINETSPYLLQHAYNPVNWYPWGEEAFQKAKLEDKPVFLSIGYSTCHWCHVMAHESFEDAEVAQILNTDYVAIKVDKEERADIDAVYMAVCQAFTGQGGWPMTIIMSPDQKPFFAGTYYPKTSRYNMPGLMDILKSVTNMWQNDRQKLLEAGNKVTALLNKSESVSGEISKELANKGFEIFKSTFDYKYGGFGKAPKFPAPHNLMFLLRYYYFTKDDKALEMVEKTLQQMYKGGIFDHIGFGFSRYSTDEKWLVPHFEKMLYDNALLAIAYLETYQITKNVLYKEVVDKVLTYVLRELSDINGGFYSAQDADSEGVEGKYYVFKPEEIINLLGEADGHYFNQYFNVTESGNFEGSNILNLINNSEYDSSNLKIEELAKKLYNYRLVRVPLHKDNKILTSWNALMIVALMKGYRILNNDNYLKSAEAAILFVDENLKDEAGELLVSYRNGKASNKGNLDDYAFMVWALLEAYQSTFESKYLTKAIELNNKLIDKFYDYADGGLYLYAKDSEQLITRPKETYDGAIPSGNSVCANNFFTIAKLTGNIETEKIANQQLQFLAGYMNNYAAGASFGLIAVLRALYTSKEVVCVIKDEKDSKEIGTLINSKFMPNTMVLVKTDDSLGKTIEFINQYQLKNNQMTFYVCENNACSAPFNDLEKLGENL